MTEKRLNEKTREDIAENNNCHIGSIVYYNAITKFYNDVLYVEMIGTSKIKVVCKPNYDANEVREFIENELVIGVEYEIVVEGTEEKTITEKDLTIKELNTLLNELIKRGHGDKEFQIYYDAECVYTTIPRGSKIRVIDDGVRFTDYR